ncbi:MAG TPA: hypothetical protein VME22_33625 [Solirubrobacteraceae bacterium]|nr:hypothetical protein [Solirubrobacteraceae bacterium]
MLDRTVDLYGVPDGYRAMANRDAIKVMVCGHDRPDERRARQRPPATFRSPYGSGADFPTAACILE